MSINTRADPRNTLRAQLTERRKLLKPAERIAAAQGLRRSLELLPEFLVDEHIGGYWAHAGELPLNLAIAPLASRGQRLYLPVIGAARSLQFVPWQTGEPVQPNRYGIPEPTTHDEAIPPAQLDLVLVPLLGFDRRGNRLGFGGGYYDTSFAFLRDSARPTQPMLVGVGYAMQELADIQPQPWDIPLDYISTEHELIDCTPEIPDG